MEIDELKRANIEIVLRNCINAKKTGISFVELTQAVGEDAKGDFTTGNGDLDPLNICMWLGVSREFNAALKAIQVEGVIEFKSASVLTYMIDGQLPNVPLARGMRKYKTLHWLPVYINLIEGRTA